MSGQWRCTADLRRMIFLHFYGQDSSTSSGFERSFLRATLRQRISMDSSLVPHLQCFHLQKTLISWAADLKTNGQLPTSYSHPNGLLQAGCGRRGVAAINTKPCLHRQDACETGRPRKSWTQRADSSKRKILSKKKTFLNTHGCSGRWWKTSWNQCYGGDAKGSFAELSNCASSQHFVQVSAACPSFRQRTGRPRFIYSCFPSSQPNKTWEFIASCSKYVSEKSTSLITILWGVYKISCLQGHIFEPSSKGVLW